MFNLIRDNAVIASSAEAITYNELQQGWVAGNEIFIDSARQFFVTNSSPKVSPIEFKLLFTSPERVAIQAGRTEDPILDDFFSLVDDPRLTFVDLGLQSTKDAIGYLVSKTLLTQERADEVLLGIIK